jgi:hypothetical protein
VLLVSGGLPLLTLLLRILLLLLALRALALTRDVLTLPVRHSGLAFASRSSLPVRHSRVSLLAAELVVVFATRLGVLRLTAIRIILTVITTTIGLVHHSS